MSRFSAVLILALLSVVDVTWGHSLRFGGCAREAHGQTNFILDKFLGKWFVIEKTLHDYRCMTFNYSRTPRPNELLLKESIETVDLKNFEVKDADEYIGTLYLPPTGRKSQMKVSFQGNPLGSYLYKVLRTDYDNWALIYSCQRVWPFRRENFDIISRTPYLDYEIKQDARNLIKDYGGLLYEMNNIPQDECYSGQDEDDETEDNNFGTGDRTVNPNNVANALRASGAKLDPEDSEGIRDLVNKYDQKFRESQGSDDVLWAGDRFFY